MTAGNAKRLRASCEADPVAYGVDRCVNSNVAPAWTSGGEYAAQRQPRGGGDSTSRSAELYCRKGPLGAATTSGALFVNTVFVGASCTASPHAMSCAQPGRSGAWRCAGAWECDGLSGDGPSDVAMSPCDIGIVIPIDVFSSSLSAGACMHGNCCPMKDSESNMRRRLLRSFRRTMDG